MSERRLSYLSKKAEVVPLSEPIVAYSKPEFKAFLRRLRKNVGIDSLLQERVAQARLDVLLNVYAERSERANNLPMVILKTMRDETRFGATTAIEHCRFQLKDNEYLYYFNTKEPKEISDYLRPQDIVPVEAYEDYRVVVDGPFIKPLNRVPVGGGQAELYNYRSAQWEDNNQGVYTGIGTASSRTAVLFRR